MKNLKFSFLLAAILFIATSSQTQATLEEIKIEEPTEQTSQSVPFLPQQDFFRHVMGVSEGDFIKLNQDKKMQFFYQETGNIVNRTTLQKFQCGKFELISVGDLREQTKSISSEQPGTFSVIEGQGTFKNKKSWFRENLDIGHLQATEQAVFQVASNLNALEALGNPKDGIGIYFFTTAQGELASLSAMAAAIARMYFIPHNGAHGQLKQTINMLEDFDGTKNFNIPVNNGYVNYFTKNYIPDLSSDEINNHVASVKIGFHEGVQVTTGLTNVKPSCDALVNDDNQIIDQVFTAAVDLNPTNFAGQNNAGTPKIELVASLLLQAAYEGTLRAAAAKGKKKVYLTLIGGGVFKNNYNQIGQAITLMKDFIISSGLEVILTIYDSQAHIEGNFEKFKDQMFDLVEATQGTYTIYKSDGKYKLVNPFKA